MNYLLLILGAALLTAGGEALIRGSLAAASRLDVSPLLSGLVINVRCRTVFLSVQNYRRRAP
jgi:cation:H+ antiporter